MDDGPGRRDAVGVAAHQGSGPRSVLVVDDDAAFVGSVDQVLKSAGFEVVVVSNGTTAVNAILSRPFDVILTDTQMPGMSGVELLRVVRSYDVDVPVILMTTQPTVETAMEAISLGALQYLAKPTPNESLLKTVERAARLNRMAHMKRDALRLAGADTKAAEWDQAGLPTQFERALRSTWMAFQPIVHSHRGRIFGYEALMRSREPSLPHPGAVLTAAERLDRLPEVGRRVRALVAEAIPRAPERATMFVNLHTRDLLDPELYEPAAPLMHFAHRVVLEVTERAAIDDVKDMQARVSALRHAGFRIAIDDLGAGYAGLSSFAALEPDIVKLDMSLIRDAHKSDVRSRLVASITALCKELQMLVVAEGIEQPEERGCALGAGCDLMQGYLFARPGPEFSSVAGMS